MRPELTALLDHISSIGQVLSPDTVGHLAARVGKLPGPSHGGGGMPAPTPPQGALTARLMELWEAVPDVHPLALSFALRSASRTAVEVASNQIVELVWTGPSAGGVPVRRNDQALLEVIESAEGELLIVSYVVHGVPAIADAIGRALERGVRVRLVFEFHGTGADGESFDPMGALGVLPSGVHVYEWPLENRPSTVVGKPGIIHVKCAVADDRLGFVSSANLTGKAMEKNMELGVLIRGGSVPVRIGEYFDALIANGILERWSGGSV